MESVQYRKLTRTQNGEVYAILKQNVDIHGDGRVTYKNEWDDQRIADHVNELLPNLPPIKAAAVADFRNSEFGKLSAAGRPAKRTDDDSQGEITAALLTQGAILQAHNVRLASLEQGMSDIDVRLTRIINKLGALAG